MTRNNDALCFMSLSSGSCGNCYYLAAPEGALLIDAGVSLRRLKKCFAENSIELSSVLGVLVTHDHLDHIRHLGSFCKHLSLPVYTTPTIHGALARHTFTADWITPCRRDILPASSPSEIPQILEIGPFRIECFIVPHDATQTVGYHIRTRSHSFTIMTDIGRMTDEALCYASKSDTVVIESNYDMGMLMGGPYTYELKMRIVQGCGHLSNDECAEAVSRFCHEGLRNIFLCHLSENNNTRELAYSATSDALTESGIQGGTISLRCLPRQTPSILFHL